MPAAPDVPDLFTRHDVAQLLGSSLEKISWWVWQLRSDRRYREFEIERHGGGEPRVIRAPIKPIKDLQRTLATVLLEVYLVPPQVHGFVNGRSAKSNAQAHERQHWVLRADIKNFFPTINFGRVRGMFMAHPFDYPESVATLLAQICCHEDELPQGAPSSPIISNLICRSLDKELGYLAARQHCFYTRFADDLCFSTDRRRFPIGIALIEDGQPVPGKELKRIVVDQGFVLNDAKTTLRNKAQRQRITGLVVNEKVNVSRQYVRSLRNLLFIWRRHGEQAAKETFNRAEPRLNWPPEKKEPEFRLVIRGRVQHVGYVRNWDSVVYRRLARELAKLDPEFLPTPAPNLGVFDVRLYTEGESDVLHMLAAARAFHEAGEFTDISFITDENSAQKSDEALLSFARSICKSPHESPCLCLFDSDNPGLLSRAVNASGWKDWGNNVLAVSLTQPPHRDMDDRICVELLYEDEAISRKDDQGRRVFLRSEFVEDTGYHAHGGGFARHLDKKSAVVDRVSSLPPNPRSISLGKLAFAERISEQAQPYEEVSFEGFRGTFDRIRTGLSELS